MSYWRDTRFAPHWATNLLMLAGGWGLNALLGAVLFARGRCR